MKTCNLTMTFKGPHFCMLGLQCVSVFGNQKAIAFKKNMKSCLRIGFYTVLCDGCAEV